MAIHCVFPIICGSEGSKNRLAKAASAEPSGQMRDEKLHAVVAGSTFGSQNVQNTPCSDMFGPLLEVDMSKKCTPLWCETHFQVKMLKTPHLKTCSDHLWAFRCRFAWQAQGSVHLVQSEQNVRVLWQFQKRWQAWDI